MPTPPNRHSAPSWIEKADEDIYAAELCLAAGERVTNVAAFHSQQAAEKLLKALIAGSGIEPPHVHDLVALTELAVRHVPAVAALAEQIEGIASWAVLTRYPSQGDTPLPTAREIEDVLPLIKQLRALVAKTVAG